MNDRRLQFVVFALVALTISAGPAASSVVVHEPRELAIVLGEGSADGFDAKPELLPLFVDFPHAPLGLLGHCHEIIPDAAVAPAARLVVDDVAARGPPIV